MSNSVLCFVTKLVNGLLGPKLVARRLLYYKKVVLDGDFY